VPLPLIEKNDFSLPDRLRHRAVLICLQDESSAELLRKRLGELSFTVDSIDDGVSALYQIRARQRSNQPYAFLFLDQQVKTIGEETLYREIRADAGFDLSRIVLVAADQNESGKRHRQMNFLVLPVTWTNLWQVFQTRQNLFVLSRHGDSNEQSAQVGPVLALIGQKVASRELVRIMLEKEGINVVVAATLNALNEVMGSSRVAVIVIDCPFSPQEELQRFLVPASSNRPPVLLIADQDATDMRLPGVRGILTRPLNSPMIRNVLLPLLNHPENDQQTEKL
jgi:DNA-binding response OmpR family regulator